MRITATVTVGEVRQNQQGKLSAQCLDSQRKEDGSWEVDNGFWASIAQGVDTFFRNLNCSQQKKPLLKIEGWLHGYGKLQQDGSYGRGFLTITKAEFVQSQPQNTAPQTAPVYQAPTAASQPAPAPVYQAPQATAPVQQPQVAPAPAPVAQSVQTYSPVNGGGFGTVAPAAAPVQPQVTPAPVAQAPQVAPATAPVQPQVAPAQATAPVAPAPQVAPTAAPAPGFVTPEAAPAQEENPFGAFMIQ